MEDKTDEIVSSEEMQPPSQILRMYANGAMHVAMFSAEAASHAIRYIKERISRLEAAIDAQGDESEDDRLRDETEDTYMRASKELAIVYAVAIFDAFLSSLTRFVFHSIPNKVLKDSTIHVSQLLAKTRGDIVAEIIDKKVDKISRESFPQRLAILRDILGVNFGHEDQDIAILRRLVIIRNTIAHDATSFMVSRSEVGQVIIGDQKRLAEEDYDIDVDVLDRLVPGIYEAVVGSLAGRPLLSYEIAMCELLRKQGLMGESSIPEG